MKSVYSIILAGMLLGGSVRSFSQGNSGRMLTMQEAFDLAAKNSAQLKVSEINTDLARQKVEIAKLGRLPEVSSGLSYGYLSNSQIWEPSFDKHLTKPIPHNLTQFSVQASEVIFKGGEVANNLKKATLEEQIAVLSQEKNLEDIKFLVAAKYLDIYRLINQREVYLDNIKLSK
jgi:outer membrane protein